MTENLLHKLEEKVTSLLKEMETLRNELNLLKLENSSLKIEKLSSIEKLQGLVSLLDASEMMRQPLITTELEVLQGKGEYA